MMAALDRRTVWLGAALGAAIYLPPIFVVRAVRAAGSGSTETALWGVAVLGILLAFPIVGAWTSRRRPEAPMIHAIFAGAGAWVFILAVSLTSRAAAGDLHAQAVVPALLMGEIAISLAMVGAWVAEAITRRRS